MDDLREDDLPHLDSNACQSHLKHCRCDGHHSQSGQHAHAKATQMRHADCNDAANPDPQSLGGSAAPRK